MKKRTKALLKSLAALAVLTPTQATYAAPMFHQSFALANKSIQLYGFNNAGDVLARLELEEGGGFRKQPVVIRGGAILTLTEVPDANVQSALANALSQRGADGHVFIAGTAQMIDGKKRAAVWNLAPDGSYVFTTAKNIVLPASVPSPGEQGVSEGLAINQFGALVGSAISGPATLATRWAAPYSLAEAIPLSTNSAFVDINENGDLLANGATIGLGMAGDHVAAAVMKANGDFLEVPALDSNLLHYPNTVVMRRGDWVIGHARVGNLTSRAFAWRVGSAISTNLPNPTFQADAEMTQVVSINAAGEALGWVRAGDFAQHLVFWKPESGRFVPFRFSDLAPGETSLNGGVSAALNNDAGQVVVVKPDSQNTTALRIFDPVGVGVVQLLTPAVSATEESGTLEFKVSLSRVKGVINPVTVRVRTEDNTAIAPGDYTALAQSVAWGPLESGEKTISVALKDNLENGPDRQFRFVLSDATSAVLAGPAEAMATITDTPQQIIIRNAAPKILGNSSVEVMAGRPEVRVEFERVGGSDGAVTINQFFTTDYSAHEGVDFTLAGGTLSWEPGELGVKTLVIPLLDAGPLAEPRVFALDGEASLSNAGSWAVGKHITILPAGQPTSPQFLESKLNPPARKLSLTARAAQGVTVQLQRRNSWAEEWATIEEALSADGFVNFELPVATGSGQVYLRALTKP